MKPRHAILTAWACLICVASGCTARWSESFSDGAEVEALTFSNLWAPNVTVIRLPDGSFHVLPGSSTMGQLTGPAAVAYSGHVIGEGLEDSGDTVNVEAASASAKGGDASAASSVDVDLDVDVNQPKGAKKWP